MVTKKFTEEEVTRLQQRLKSHLDYYIAFLLWGLFLFSFISVWIVGSLDPEHAGFNVAIQTAPFYLFFPGFATFGMIADRILTKDLLKLANYSTSIEKEDMISKLNREDYLRIGIILSLVLVGLPWIAARLGLFLTNVDSTIVSQVIFFQPVHLGDHHGFIGIYMLLSVLLISKTEKLYNNSIFKEITIYFLCFIAVWGLGLMIDDFFTEQLNLNFPMIVWFESFDLLGLFMVQCMIIAGISGLIYYFIWRKFYKLRINQ